jgi:hypothetical protein
MSYADRIGKRVVRVATRLMEKYAQGSEFALATPMSGMTWQLDGPYSSFLFHCVRFVASFRPVMRYAKEVF